MRGTRSPGEKECSCTPLKKNADPVGIAGIIEGQEFSNGGVLSRKISVLSKN